MIHRFTLDGVDRGRFDHGVQALAASGLPPIAFDPRKRLNIESPEFDSGNPATWAYRTAGCGVCSVLQLPQRGRLYYSVAAGLRIWSVSILPDGSFGNDARVRSQRSAQRFAANAEISGEILFDDNGDMFLAERGEPTGAYDYKVAAALGENRVLRFRPKRPRRSAKSRSLVSGFERICDRLPPGYRNDNGGIAIGYGYDAAGNINRAVCGGPLWSTGEQLRNARDPADHRSAFSPAVRSSSMACRATPRRCFLRPRNEPPSRPILSNTTIASTILQTHSGHFGDVVIRACARAGCAAAYRPCGRSCARRGLFNVDGDLLLAGLAVRRARKFANGCCVYRGCPPSYVRIRGRCVPPPLNCGPNALYSNDLRPDIARRRTVRRGLS